MEQPRIDPATVKGWGVDANPKNDPTYPMKNRNNGEHAGYTWKRPSQQPPTVEILHSNERPNLTAVFGTSTPPIGLSGVLRRLAFKYSESSYGHWLPLMAADRIGIAEGLLNDVAHGKLPNVFVERGGRAEWKHNRTSLAVRMLARLVIISGVVAFIFGRTESDRR